MTQTRDFADLIEILSEHKKTYQLLLSLSRAQTSVFEEGGPGALMKVIARKQDVIGRLKLIDARLSRYTSNWSETMRALPEQARREVSDLMGEIALQVADLMASERATEAVVSAARDAAGARMKSVSEGIVAAKAYGPPALTGAGRLLDREG